MLSEIAFYGALETGLIYGLVAFGIYLSFRVLDFPDLTVDGSFPLGAAVAAMLIIEGWNPWLATGCAVLAGMAAGAVKDMEPEPEPQPELALQFAPVATTGETTRKKRVRFHGIEVEPQQVSLIVKYEVEVVATTDGVATTESRQSTQTKIRVKTLSESSNVEKLAKQIAEKERQEAMKAEEVAAKARIPTSAVVGTWHRLTRSPIGDL